MSRIDTWTPRKWGFSPHYRTLDFAYLDRQFWQTAAPPKRVQSVQTLPFSLNRKLEMSVEMQIFGRRASGIIDTVAQTAILDETYLKLGGARRRRKIYAPTRGGKTAIQRTTIPNLTLAGQSYTDIPAILYDHRRQPQQRNSFPTCYLRGRLLDFDFPNQTLRLRTDAPLTPQRQAKTVLGYTKRQGCIFIPIQINGVAGAAIIDTGASQSSINAEFMQRAKLSLATPTTPAPMAELQGLMLGEILHPDMLVMLERTSMPAHAQQNDTPLMRLGLDILHKYRVQIDRDTHRATFSTA